MAAARWQAKTKHMFGGVEKDTELENNYHPIKSLGYRGERFGARDDAYFPTK